MTRREAYLGNLKFFFFDGVCTQMREDHRDCTKEEKRAHWENAKRIAAYKTFIAHTRSITTVWVPVS